MILYMISFFCYFFLVRVLGGNKGKDYWIYHINIKFRFFQGFMICRSLESAWPWEVSKVPLKFEYMVCHCDWDSLALGCSWMKLHRSPKWQHPFFEKAWQVLVL